MRPHLRLLSRAIVDGITGRGPDRIMACMPPRHGKSELCSKYVPPWYVGTYPNNRVILASYEADFAAEWGGKSRDLAEEHGWMFGVRVNQRSSASHKWDLQGFDGGMRTSGARGSITGKGAHLFLIDDPIKNAEEAASETIREKVWDWYRSTAYTRLEPGAVIILIQTRWHEDDLAGRLLAEAADGGEQWRVINFPAIAEEADELGRLPGEPLWPERYSLKQLEKIKRSVGSYYWSALYQQRPTPADGEIFQRKWIEIVDDFPREAKKAVRYWDKAATEGGGKYSAGVLGVMHEGIVYIVNVTRGQWSAFNRNKVIKQTADLDSESFGRGRVAVWVEQEPGSGGKESAEFTIRQLAGSRVRADRVTGDKVTRARPLSSQFEAGNVKLVRGAWNREFIDELISFPNGTFKDQVDASSGMFNKLTEARRFAVGVG